MARRYYSSTAARTTLASGVDDTTTTLSVVAVSGWPASYPYTLVLDQDTVNEELVSVTNRSGTTLTVTRGIDGTSAVAHDAGAAVNHGVSAQDFDEPNAFINGTGVVTETLLATNSVSAAKIVDGTITNAKIGASADIAQSKIENLTSDLASKLPYSYGTATPTTSDSGYLWYDSNSTPPVAKYWNGSSFATLVPDSGLNFITSEAVSGSSVSINGCFSATYDSYLLVWDLLNTSNQTVTVRLRAAGTDETGSNYIRTFHGNDQATTGGAGNLVTSTSWDGAFYAYAQTGSSTLFLHRPFLADETHGSFTTNVLQTSTPAWVNRVGALHHTQSVSYDGLTLAAASGTITGRVSVYGLKD